MISRGVLIATILIAALVVTACGASPTAIPLPTSTAVPPTATLPPPTATPIPPTATPLPPTDVPLTPTDTPRPVEPPGEGDPLFHNEVAGYSILYPKGWKTFAFEETSSDFFFSSEVVIKEILSGESLPQVPVVGITSGPIDIIYEGQLAGAESAEEVLDTLLAWVSEYESFEAGEVTTLPLAGEEAIAIDVAWSQDGDAVMGRDIVLKQGDRALVIQTVGREETWDAFLPAFEGMVESLVLFEPTTQRELSEEYEGELYTILYPSDWVVYSLGELTVLVESDEILDEAVASVPVILIESGSLDTLAGGIMTGTQSAEEMLEALGQSRLADNPDIHLGNIEPVSGGGNLGAAVSVLFFEEGIPAMNLSFALHLGDWGILIQGIGSVEGWADFSDVYGDMVDSLVVYEREEGSVDFADPASVVQAIFAAARAQEYALLSSLCDPLGEHDGDMDLICTMNEDHPDKESFIAFFANAQVAGEPVIDGDQAQVPVLVGPDGDQEEIMNLVQREGKWYLLGF